MTPRAWLSASLLAIPCWIAIGLLVYVLIRIVWP